MKGNNSNKTIRYISTILVVLLYHFNVQAQNTCIDGYLVIPKEFESYCKQSYLKDIYNNRIDLRDLDYRTNRCWAVFSDRDNNNLYSSKNGRRTNDKLSFMERLLVKEVSGNWLHVYSGVLTKNGRVENNVDRGWIKADKLILSDFAGILNEKSITRKGFVLTSLNNIDPANMKRYEDELTNKYFYSTPNQNTSNRNGKKAKVFQIYYILKESQSMVLLSRVDKISGSTKVLQESVYGWIPKINVTNWDNRVCLEQNYGLFVKK